MTAEQARERAAVTSYSTRGIARELLLVQAEAYERMATWPMHEFIARDALHEAAELRQAAEGITRG